MAPSTLTHIQVLDDLALLDAARAYQTPDTRAALLIEELVRRFERYAEAPDAYPFLTDDAALRPCPETAL